jgi:hypothetical protein
MWNSERKTQRMGTENGGRRDSISECGGVKTESMEQKAFEGGPGMRKLVE